jgi:hypothetical protein
MELKTALVYHWLTRPVNAILPLPMLLPPTSAYAEPALSLLTINASLAALSGIRIVLELSIMPHLVDAIKTLSSTLRNKFVNALTQPIHSYLLLNSVCLAQVLEQTVLRLSQERHADARLTLFTHFLLINAFAQ